MDEQELQAYQSMPDYVEIGKVETGAVPKEPSKPDETEQQQGTEGEPTDETDPEEGQPKEAEEETEEPEESDKFTVKIGDSEEEVTLDELKSSYMRQADYTRKTSELAEKRRALEEQTTARGKEIERMQTLLSAAEQNLSIILKNSEARPLRDGLNQVNVSALSNEELAEYTRLEARCRQLEAKEQQQLAAFEAERKKFEAEQQKMIEEQYRNDQALLAEELPDFKDPVKRGKLNKDISDYMVAVYGEKKAKELAPSIRSRDDYMTLYYASIGKKFLENKTPAKVIQKAALTAKNQAGAQSTTQISSKKAATAALNRIKSHGDRGEASDADIINYLMQKG